MKKNKGNKAVYVGLVIVAIGVIWLLRRLGVYVPHWLTGWEMILILIGTGIGVESRFRNPASYILIAIGGIALIDEVLYLPMNFWDYFWPVSLIAIGLIVIFKPKRDKARIMRNYSHGTDSDTEESEDLDADDADPKKKGTYSREDKLDMVSVFTGSKKTVFSRNFVGGETVTVFGGSELNLLNADFDKVVYIEATVVFGGLKLIVPAGWEVRHEVNSILAGVEDKRYTAVNVVPQDKVIVLTGTVVFGGIDIVSY